MLFIKKPLHFLNISQFLGVVNDNIFKFIIVFLFIHLQGEKNASEILFWVGTVYVIPFLLFSQAAGAIADQMSKQKLIIILKAVEVGVMALGVVAIAYQSTFASYSLLFLLSMQSAVFGPPKYSIIPELVQEGQISKANGLITSFTYLGIIVGTFLASFLTQITNKNFVLTTYICVVFAIVGFLSSLCIPKTEIKSHKEKINPHFIVEIYKTLKSCKDKPFLLVSICGASSFLFVGAFFQLNIIPYAMQSLHISEVGGGYLFLVTAIGIAFGSIIAGKLSKKRVEVGLSALAGLFLVLILFLLSIFHKTLYTVIPLTILIGFAGGLFIVPFDSYVQTFSPDKSRGKIIAASNFLSFCGVLLAPICLYLFGGILKLQASTGFFLVGLIFLALLSTILPKISHLFFNYFTRLILRGKYKISFNPNDAKILIAPVFTIKTLLFLAAADPSIEIFIAKENKSFFDKVITLFSSIRFLYAMDQKTQLLQFLEHAEKSLQKSRLPCLFLRDLKETLPKGIQTIEIKKQKKDLAFFSKEQVIISVDSRKNNEY